MDSPEGEGETPQTEPADRNNFKQVRILKMDSPKGETPQTERTLHKKSLLARWGLIPPFKLAVTPSSIEAGVLR